LNTAQRELKRATDLIEGGYVSRLEYDNARDRFSQAKIALDTAKANLESQKLAVKEAQERANQQRSAVQEAKTGIKSSEMRPTSSKHCFAASQVNVQRPRSYLRLPALSRTFRRASESMLFPLCHRRFNDIADMSTINVEVNVDETEISNVEVGSR